MAPITIESARRIAHSAARMIRDQWATTPSAGLVLGTGSGILAEQIKAEFCIPYAELANFPRSTAIGHVGQFVCGDFSGRPVIAMQGRFHRYEGYSPAAAACGVLTMAELGIPQLLISNAAGGLQPQMQRGDILLITSLIDLMFRPLQDLTEVDFPSRPRVRSDTLLDRVFIQQAESVARRDGFRTQRGVYCGLLGPNYETRAEYRLLRRIGADAVGMSTVPEVQAAAQLGLKTLVASIITNVAKPDALSKTTGEDVVDAARTAARNLAAIFAHLVSWHRADAISPSPPEPQSTQSDSQG